MYKYGDFRSEGTEFAVNVPNTPRSFDNFMWNDVCFANVQQTGVGCFDYQLDEREAVQLYTGIGRICDFDVFGREHLMNRLIYIRDNETGSYFTVNWECVKADYTSFSCVHGAGYTVITNETDGIRASFRIFVPQGKDAAELWDITLESVDGRKRDISVFLYNQIQFKFKWGFDSYGDMIYRTVWLDKEQNAVIAKKHPFVKPHDFLTAYVAANRKIDAFDGTRDAFVGVYSTLKDPEAVVRGYCSNTQGSADATITALQFNLTLDGKAEKAIMFCGTGVGASIACNKIPGIRASMIHDVHCAHQAVEHDDVQVMCIGEKIVGEWLAPDLIRVFLEARANQDDWTPHVVRMLNEMDGSSEG